MADAVSIDWDSALVWTDDRFEYDEQREIALGSIGDRVYYVVFVDRQDVLHIISMRYATKSEVKFYVENYPN